MLLVTTALASCGPVSKGTTHAQPSPTAAQASGSVTPTPSPAILVPSVGAAQAQVTCTGHTTSAMALVGSAEGQISLADTRDPAKPQTLCTFTGVRAPKFASSTDISYVTVSNYSPSTSSTDFKSSIVRQPIEATAGQTMSITRAGSIPMPGAQTGTHSSTSSRTSPVEINMTSWFSRTS